MTPLPGQHIKCLMINNSVVEGIVENWSSSSVQLKSLDGSNILIIHHPDRDIILTKIVLENEVKEELKQNFQTELEKPQEEIFNNLKDKNLLELKKELNLQEKRIIAEKLKQHYVGDVRKVQYEYPGFLSQPGSK